MPADADPQLGLPRRLRQASLAPQLRDAPPAASSGGQHEARSAEQVRALISSIQQGWRSGRASAGRPDEDFPEANPGSDLIDVVARSGRPAETFSSSPERSRILELCRDPIAVADRASAIGLPLGVVRVRPGAAGAAVTTCRSRPSAGRGDPSRCGC